MKTMVVYKQLRFSMSTRREKERKIPSMKIYFLSKIFPSLLCASFILLYFWKTWHKQHIVNACISAGFTISHTQKNCSLYTWFTKESIHCCARSQSKRTQYKRYFIVCSAWYLLYIFNRRREKKINEKLKVYRKE